MNKQISIIGCGWLGFPLALQLIKEGYIIKGSTTTSQRLAQLEENGIEAYLLYLEEQKLIGDASACLSGSNTAIVNIPPGLRKTPQLDLVQKMTPLLEAIEASGVEKVIYISSTSVYEDTKALRWVDETSETGSDHAARQLVAVEKLFLQSRGFKTSVIRFGGLYGHDRHPATYLAEKQNVKNPEAPVNLIHREDCIQIIAQLLHHNSIDIVNAVSPQHPSREKYYTWQCLKKGLVPPQFDHSSTSKGKYVQSKLLEETFNYRFLHCL